MTEFFPAFNIPVSTGPGKNSRWYLARLGVARLGLAFVKLLYDDAKRVKSVE
jgi:hypothetical protein